VVSSEGKEAIIATLREGDFFGEGTLTGQSKRIGTAVAATACTILAIEKGAMARLLHEQHEFSDRFITYMLTRNCRIESDLIDQLFNSSEKRLARALLLLAQYGTSPPPDPDVVNVSQDTLAKTIGTTRTRVNFFMNKFRKAGYINYSGDGLKVNSTLVNVLLHD
jgi:CRP-like cAMP-binding protein